MPTDKTQMDAVRDHLERFSERGERHLFRLRDGRAFEGWMVEVGEEDVLVMSAGPGASEDETPIPIAEIDCSTLAYIDETGAQIPFALVAGGLAS